MWGAEQKTMPGSLDHLSPLHGQLGHPGWVSRGYGTQRCQQREGRDEGATLGDGSRSKLRGALVGQ